MSNIKATKSANDRPGRWVNARCVLIFPVLAILFGCTPDNPESVELSSRLQSSDGESPATSDTSSNDPSQKIYQLRIKAAQAWQRQRLHSPAGDNAIEYYLSLRASFHKRDPSTENALIELLPYAMIASEQAIARDDLTQAKRLIELIQKIDASSPGIARLNSALAAESNKLDKTQQGAVSQTQPVTPKQINEPQSQLRQAQATPPQPPGPQAQAPRPQVQAPRPQVQTAAPSSTRNESIATTTTPSIEQNRQSASSESRLLATKTLTEQPTPQTEATISRDSEAALEIMPLSENGSIPPSSNVTSSRNKPVSLTPPPLIDSRNTRPRVVVETVQNSQASPISAPALQLKPDPDQDSTSELLSDEQP